MKSNQRVPHSIVAFGNGTVDSGIVMLTDEERDLIHETLNNGNWLARSGDDVIDIIIEPVGDPKKFGVFMDGVFDGFGEEECRDIISQFEDNPDFVSWFKGQMEDLK